MADNIIEFPIKSEFPSTVEEAQEKLFQVRSEFVSEVLEDVTERLFNDISNYGFSLQMTGSHYKDIYFVTEAIHAMLLRYVKVPHNMHDVIDNTVEINPVQESEDEAKKDVDITS